jgi:hypothetical protein
LWGWKFEPVARWEKLALIFTARIYIYL